MPPLFSNISSARSPGSATTRKGHAIIPFMKMTIPCTNPTSFLINPTTPHPITPRPCLLPRSNPPSHPNTSTLSPRHNPTTHLTRERPNPRQITTPPTPLGKNPPTDPNRTYLPIYLSVYMYMLYLSIVPTPTPIEAQPKLNRTTNNNKKRGNPSPSLPYLTRLIYAT